MGAPNRPRTGEKLHRADWKKRAVKLAEMGWSLRKIARQVGKAHSNVHAALVEELEARKPSAEEVDLMRAKMSAQIESQIKAWFPRSTNGNKDAALALARFWERLAKLYGLDAPTKSELTGADGAPLIATPTEAARLVREQFESAAAKRDDKPEGFDESRGSHGDLPPGPPSK